MKIQFHANLSEKATTNETEPGPRDFCHILNINKFLSKSHQPLILMQWPLFFLLFFYYSSQRYLKKYLTITAIEDLKISGTIGYF